MEIFPQSSVIERHQKMSHINFRALEQLAPILARWLR
jgi:hypothetical protein